MQLRDTALVFIYSFLIAIQSNAAQPRLFQSPLSKNLIESTVSAVHRDSQGVLWIGTKRGLHRFDGSDVTIFSSKMTNRNWIPANVIYDIAEDREGNLLVATKGGGLLEWSKSSQQFEISAISKANKAADFIRVYTSVQGNIWLGTEDEVFLYNPDFTADRKEDINFPIKSIKGTPYTFMEDGLGNLLVGTNLGLEKISILDSSFIEKTVDIAQILGKSSVTAIARDKNGNLIIGTNTGHLAILNEETNAILKKTKIGGESIVYISNFAFYNSSIYVATDRGLFATDSELSAVMDLSRTGAGLSNNDIFSLFGDGKNIWIGTFDGLDLLSFPAFDLFNEKNSGIPNDILSFGEDERGRIWIGTYSGLYMYDDSNQYHRKFQPPTSSPTLMDDRVTSIASIRDQLWLGYFQGGVKVIDNATGAFYTPDLPHSTELAVTKILTNPDSNDIWIATYGHGLLRVKAENDRLYYETLPLPEKRIIQIFLTKNSELLIAAESGLFYLHRINSGNLSRLDFKFQGLKQRPSVYSINQSKNGDILIGTDYHGLFFWSQENQSAGKLELRPAGGDGLLENSSIYGLELDSFGNLWCSTQNGIVKLDHQGNFLDRFSTFDGLQDKDFSIRAAFTAKSGVMYFGGTSGYNRFNPKDISVERSPSQMRLTGIQFPRENGKKLIDVSDFTSIQLTHKDKFVTFEFSVLDFIDPQNNQYRYKLEGFDTDWIDNGNRNTATYTNLPSGDYRLRVQGANSAGIWNREGLSIALNVLPAPWLMWWAFCFYGLVLLVAGWSAHRTYRSYAIDRKAIQLSRERYEAEERADDDMQEQLEIQDDIVKSAYQHNLGTLSLISDFINSQASKDQDDGSAQQIPANMKRIAALANLEDCLFYHAGGPAADLKKYTEIVLSQLLACAPVNAETIVTVNEIPATLVPAVLASPLSIVIYEILENCIQHAFVGNSPANYIQISLTSERNEQHTGDLWTLTVRDTGIGIPTGISNPQGGNSGLAIVNKVITKLQGAMNISSDGGTTVQITLPYDIASENPAR